MRDYRITLEDALSVFKGLKQNVERLISSGYIQAFQDCVDDLDITLGVNEQLRAKIDELKEGIDKANDELKAENKELKEENSKMKSERIGSKPYYQSINKYVNKIKELVANNTDLKTKVNDLEDTNNWFKKYDSEIQQINASLRSEIEKLKAVIASRDKEISIAIKAGHKFYQTDELKEENNKLKERNEYLEEAENEYADKCEEKYMLNKQLKAKVDELEELLIVQGKDYASLEKDIDKYESIIKGLKTQNEQLEEESKTIANNDSIAKITKEFMELYNSSTKKTEETEEKSNKGTHKMILRRM